MEQTRAAPPTTAALVDAHRDGAEAATGLIKQAVSPNTRDAYAGALRRLSAWLDGRALDDRSLAAYLGSLHKTGRTPATAALVVAAVRRAAHDANENAPDGPLTRQTLEGFRRTAAAAGAPAHHSLARGLTAEECDAVLAACCRRRRTGSGLEREETAMRRGLIDGAIVALLFHGALRRSEVAALRWADVDLSGDDDVVVTVRRSKTNPAGDRADVRRLVGGCAAAVRRLHAATSPTPTEANHRPGRPPDQPPVRGRLRRRRPRRAQDLAQRPRRTRRRAHRPRGQHARHPARRRLEGRRHGRALRDQHQHQGRRGEPVHAGDQNQTMSDVTPGYYRVAWFPWYQLNMVTMVQ